MGTKSVTLQVEPSPREHRRKGSIPAVLGTVVVSRRPQAGGHRGGAICTEGAPVSCARVWNRAYSAAQPLHTFASHRELESRARLQDGQTQSYLQIKKLRFREVASLVQSHTAD